MKQKIIDWIKDYGDTCGCEGFVVGVSGGVDSALTSTLCALTGKKVVVVGLPIHQETVQLNRSQQHMDWLCATFENVNQVTVDLSQTFEAFKKDSGCISLLALANVRSRLRMLSLYAVANSSAKNVLVVGTGNKVEDYGVGFFTKYGDGGVDISPIAGLLKSEVRIMARELGVMPEIVDAIPTDGLWEDSRSDEDQIGASYDELEWALKYYDENGANYERLSPRNCQVLKIYEERHLRNKHKLLAPPTFSYSDRGGE